MANFFYESKYNLSLLGEINAFGFIVFKVQTYFEASALFKLNFKLFLV